MNEDPIYIRLGRRFQRIPADIKGAYLMFVKGELFLTRKKDRYWSKPIGVVIDQNGEMLTVAEYETSGPMNFEEATISKDIALGYIKPRCELPSRCELLQMYEQKDKFPASIAWLWSKEGYSINTSWSLYWGNGYMDVDYRNRYFYVRRVFRISIKSLFV